MAKITSLTDDNGISMYYDKAMSKYDSGDLVGCLDLLFTARRLLNAPGSDDDLALTLEIADTYADMGLLDEANKYYLRLTPFNYELADIYYSLIRNYIIMGEPELAVYYLNLGIDIGLLDSEDGFAPEEIEALINPPKEKLRLVDNCGDEYLMQVARQLASSCDTEFAKQMLSNISPRSKNYATAANYLAIIEISGGNIEEGIKWCDSVLENDPSNVNALTAKIIGCKYKGSEAEVEELTQRLLEIDIKDSFSLGKVAMCMAEIGNNKLTAVFCERSLKESPFEQSIMLLCALAQWNTGNRDRAKELMVTLCSVYPEDYTAKYYARLLSDECREEPFALTVTIDKCEEDERERVLSAQIDGAKNPDDFIDKYEENELLEEYVHWALTEGDDRIAVKVGSFIARTPRGFALARQTLLLPHASIALKKELLIRLFSTGRVFKLSTVINGRLLLFRSNLPKVTRRADFVEAYWQLFGALAFIEDDFEKKLNACYKKVFEALCSLSDKLDSKAIAAVIAYKSQINKIFSRETYCCEVFDCEKKDFMLYLGAVDEYEAKLRSTPKRPQVRKRKRIGNKDE